VEQKTLGVLLRKIWELFSAPVWETG